MLTRNHAHAHIPASTPAADVSPVLQATLTPGAGPAAAPADALDAAVAAAGMKADAAATVVVVDGQIDEQRSSMGGLPQGVYVGGLAGAPQDVTSFALVSEAGGPMGTGPFDGGGQMHSRAAVGAHAVPTKLILCVRSCTNQGVPLLSRPLCQQ